MYAHPHPPLLSTFMQGSHWGTKPIDGIWVSQDLPVAFSSWCSFAMSPGDHRAGVIDLDLAALIGEPHQTIIWPKACQLTCAIPSSWDAYNQLFLQSSHRHLLLPKLHALFVDSSLPTFDWNSFGPCIEALDTLKSQCMKHAEKHCQKLCMGQVPFSPDLMKFYFLQQLWLLVWRKKVGHRISSTKICHLSKKCALPLASQASLVEAEANYWAASL